MKVRRKSPPASPEGHSAFAEIHSLAASLHALHRQQAALLTPIAEQLIREKSRNQAEIERTLDLLLDSACIPEGLAPFKALCCYYYNINPAATASYVRAYRDLWDSEDAPDQEVVP